ncbi:hypothetical protein ABZ387_07030 [Streptomyces flaveolus]|uniref:hypothetical protein n=1 Tax=Streptomyces flaveolus TaxID=67297 RepID=UPI0033DDE6B6
MIPYTQCPGGFVTARTLPDGRILVEGWQLNLAPFDSDQPRHEIAFDHLAATPAEAEKTVAEFVGWLDKPLGAGLERAS